MLRIEESTFKKMILLFLCIWFIFVGMKTIKWTPVPMGESDDYILTTISLQNRMELVIREEDIKRAVDDFPEFSEYLEYCYDMGEQSDIIDEYGGRVPWYFGTYSAAVIPMKLVFSLLEIPQIYAYAVTNFILYFIALLMAGFILKRKSFERLFLILLLGINPALFYIVWQSAEVFIFTFVSVSLVFWMNKNYKLSALFVSIAGSLNSTIMIYGAILIIDYFIELIYDKQDVSTIKYIFNNWGKIICFGLCFIPCLIPFVYYKMNYGIWNLQVSYGFAMGGGNDYFQRVAAYLFDWNYGVLPYFPILFLLFIAGSFYILHRKRWRKILFVIAFLGVVFAFSIMWHINCGMSGIARYTVWTLPIMLFGSLEIFKEICIVCKSRMLLKACYMSLFISIVYEAVLVSQYGIMFANKTKDNDLTPIAKIIIEECPQLYWSIPSTFITRVSHQPGGYWYSEPVIYATKTGEVKKILVSGKTADRLFEQIVTDYQGERFLTSKIDTYENDDKFHFITIPKGYDVRISATYIMSKNNIFNGNEIDIQSLPTDGEYDEERKAILLDNGEIQYGPYITLSAGTYVVCITGKNLTGAELHINSISAGDMSNRINILKYETDEIIYNFSIYEEISDFECSLKNISEDLIQIDAVHMDAMNIGL